MNVLGLSYNYHDSAACLVRDGLPVAAAEEERFSRLKHDSRFPAHAIAYCLREAALVADDLDAIAFYEKPARKLARVLQIGKLHAPRSAANVALQFPQVIEDGLGVEACIRDRLNYQGPLYFCEHHLSHAASAFHVSPFEESAILTVDGVGEWATCTQFSASAARIEKRREIDYPHSLGLLYSTLTAYLGFAVNDDEYKVMGLASYGVQRYRAELDRLIELHEDGSFSLALPYFAYTHDTRTMHDPQLEALLGPARKKGEPIEERHRDIAASLQGLTEDAMVALARSCLRNQPSRNLCLAGGVAYNCVANTKVAKHGGFDRIFVQPAAGDNGAAMGAALWASHAVLNVPRFPREHHTLLGPAFDDHTVLDRLKAFGLRFEQFSEEALCVRVAQLIHDNFIVGWVQGRMEFGPRALGGRSILANPCAPDMKDILNSRVKFREEFRPFAPAVIEEAAHEYFELEGPSPFMLFAPMVRPARAAEIPAVTHVDGTARVQTVSKLLQPLFYRLIQCFAALSGTPVLINTSFNIRGEPIVCSPDDAIKCFLGTDIDFLAIGTFLASKV